MWVNERSCDCLNIHLHGNICSQKIPIGIVCSNIRNTRSLEFLFCRPSFTFVPHESFMVCWRTCSGTKERQWCEERCSDIIFSPWSSCTFSITQQHKHMCEQSQVPICNTDYLKRGRKRPSVLKSKQTKAFKSTKGMTHNKGAHFIKNVWLLLSNQDDSVSHFSGRPPRGRDEET